MDYERYLIAAWLNKVHLEHIKEFEEFTFYPELLRALHKIKKIDFLLLSKESGTPVSELATMMTDYMPTLYENAYKMAKEEKIKAMLVRVAQNPQNIAESVDAILKEIEDVQSGGINAPTNLVNAYKQELEKRKTVETVKYGIDKLDYNTGGIRRQELTVIAARPSIGKTALALQIAFNASLKNKNVLFFPLEMTPAQLMERVACRDTKIQHEKLKDPKKLDKKDQDELDRFLQLYAEVMQKYLNVIEHTRNLADIRKHIKYYKPDLVIIDQLSQLREDKLFKSVREQFTYMTNNLKAISMELDVPIILLAQVNRGADDKEPTLADLKESGSIEEDADNVIMIHKTGELNRNDMLIPMNLIIRKQRNGENNVAVSTKYNCKKFMFEEVR